MGSWRSCLTELATVEKLCLMFEHVFILPKEKKRKLRLISCFCSNTQYKLANIHLKLLRHRNSVFLLAGYEPRGKGASSEAGVAEPNRTTRPLPPQQPARSAN